MSCPSGKIVAPSGNSNILSSSIRANCKNNFLRPPSNLHGLICFENPNPNEASLLYFSPIKTGS
ncbi:hypothetical protein C1H46_033951 [Malus baccata]|uniref:Uncharacterized protein n=1 Tax=Malus baccata TaxID=106549 RepID=A0A540L206_MALBA|nr:hypothetical protein C1H46_033951 [Malus baccata]